MRIIIAWNMAEMEDAVHYKYNNDGIIRNLSRRNPSPMTVLPVADERGQDLLVG